ncbi:MULTISPECIES: hypothetical protein [unclassified Acidisoma]|uniref:hypothetical protein n=1 Tax=unclassified Acidisoma TaxID=2634065 RepID=UPI00131BE31E|nr:MULTISPECIES: hypothetical protein [unclassified Acidisoma]
MTPPRQRATILMIIVVFLFETNLTVNATPLGKTSGIICGRRVSSWSEREFAEEFRKTPVTYVRTTQTEMIPENEWPY